MNELNDNRGAELDELKTRLMKENAFLKMLASKPMSVCFDAYRTKAYDGGGEENLTFQVNCTSKFLVMPRPLIQGLFWPLFGRIVGD